MSARVIKKCPLYPEFTKEHFTIYTDLAHASIKDGENCWRPLWDERYRTVAELGGMRWEEKNKPSEKGAMERRAGKARCQNDSPR